MLFVAESEVVHLDCFLWPNDVFFWCKRILKNERESFGNSISDRYSEESRFDRDRILLLVEMSV